MKLKSVTLDGISILNNPKGCEIKTLDIDKEIETASKEMKKYIRKQIAISRWKTRK